MQWGGGWFCYLRPSRVGPLKAHTGGNASGASLQLSLLSSTVLSAFSCVLSTTHVLIHALKCSRKAQECHSLLQQVPPLQDCCAFQLVPVCTMEEDTSRCQASAMHITIFGIPGWVPTEACSRKHKWNLPQL